MANCAICLLTLFIIVYIIVAVVGEQYFVEMPPLRQEVKTGDDVHLRCTVYGKRGQCFWLKDQRPVIAQQGKYEWTSNLTTDCTLLIRQATLLLDDGFWECHHVSFSDLFHQDRLSSEPSRLVVMVKPRKPILEYDGFPLEAALTLKEGQKVTISCVSKYGNPPAVLKWYIGNTQIESLEKQKNAPEVDNQKTYAAHSILQVRARKEYHGLPIRCLAVHPTSTIPASAESPLNIQYVPEVRLMTSPEPLTMVPEDLVSSFKLKCLADANPSVSIKWYKDAVPISESSFDATLPALSLIQSRTIQVNDTTWSAEISFEPVKRYDAGLYSCKATNKIGESAPASYRLDVQYGPRLKRTDRYNFSEVVEETALLDTTVESFNCPEFEANPPAQYRWVHLHGGSTDTIEVHVQNKGDGRLLRLENIMWSNEGEYRCIAFNTINGFKRELASDVRYVLHVTGPPKIQVRPLADKNFRESIGWAGESVHRLKSRFCSRPPPKLVAWQWGSSHIRAGENIHPKYEALPLEPIVENKMATNCYWAKLDIKDLQKEDARMYTLLVESEKGRDSTNIKLIVKDSTEMRMTAAGVAVGLLILLALISVGVYSLLRIRRRRYRQKIVEESSIAADALYGNGATMDRQKSFNLSHVQTVARKPSLESSQGTYDYSHIAKSKGAMSPEALKVRRAPMVLQPPTKV